MKTKLFAVMLFAAASAFAESRFSISIGTYSPGYYGQSSRYYAQVGPQVLYRSNGRSNYGRYGGYGYGGGAGYWGESPQRRHERAERNRLRNHQQAERYIYGDSSELSEHQMQEHHELRHEQRYERNGDFESGDGPAHGSARDGFYGRR